MLGNVHVWHVKCMKYDVGPFTFYYEPLMICVRSRRCGNLAAARELLEQALKEDCWHAPSHQELGHVLKEEGDLAQAARLFSQAARINAQQRSAAGKPSAKPRYSRKAGQPQY